MFLRLLFLFAFVVGTANAATLEFSFHQGGYDGSAYVDGYFAGKDNNNDGLLSSSNGEISAFSFSFSGNSLIQAFSANAMESSGFNLDYFINNNSYTSLDIYNADISDPSNIPYFTYNGFGGRTENHELFTGLIEVGVFFHGDRFFDRTITLEPAEIQKITANNVPLPLSIYLFVSGLAILMRFNKLVPKRSWPDKAKRHSYGN